MIQMMECPSSPFACAVTPAQPCADPASWDLDALQTGDEYAFRCLVKQLKTRLTRHVCSMIDDHDAAQNIVQETFAEAYRQIDRFREDAKLSTWLFSIARHLAYRHLHYTQRYQFLPHGDIEFVSIKQERFASSVRARVEQNERIHIVRAALRRLPDHYQQVIELRDLQEHSTAETTDRLGLTDVNVRVRLHRVRKRLRKVLCARFCTSNGAPLLPE